MKNKNNNEYDFLYLKVWKWSSEHSKIRWTVCTFFMGISFAIFGFSFTNPNKLKLIKIISGIMAIVIYWFSYALFMRFHKYTECLRNILGNWEGKIDSIKNVNYDLQKQIDIEMRSKKEKNIFKKIKTENLLLYFGIIYSLLAFISTFVLLYEKPITSFLKNFIPI